MLVNPEELLVIHRYEEEEIPFLNDLIVGAEYFLYNAGAYKPDNALTKVVIELMVGFWLENRDSNYTDYVKIGQFPLGMQSLITSLQYYDGENVPPEPKAVIPDEKSTNS